MRGKRDFRPGFRKVLVLLLTEKVLVRCKKQQSSTGSLNAQDEHTVMASNYFFSLIQFGIVHCSHAVETICIKYADRRLWSPI